MRKQLTVRAVTISGVVALALSFALARSPNGIAALDSCAAISPRNLETYQRTITATHKSATADASRNGTSGQYAVAATNSRDLLERAQGRVTSAISDLRRSDPSVTTAEEAGTVKEHVRYILEVVPQAAHWSMISEIYHDSPEAWKAFEGSIKVLEEGNRIFAEAGRCYMEGL
jgi:hypothetical protein